MGRGIKILPIHQGVCIFSGITHFKFQVFMVYIFCVLFSEVEPLLKMAADKGVEEAKKALKDLYPHRYT